MIDLRYEMMKALKTRLDFVDASLEVFSDIPDDYPNPFIYLGNIQYEEIQNKDNFLYRGIVTVELYTGTSKWIGSIKEPIDWLNTINYRMKTSKTDFPTIPYFRLGMWKLSSNTGLQRISTTEKLYVGTIQYSFEANYNGGFI